jgi:hypothetical protein
MSLPSLHQLRRAVLAIVLLLPLCIACERKPTAITPQLIDQFLKAVDAGSAKRDPSVLIEHMAPDALITIKMNGPNGAQIVRLNGKDYQDRVKCELALLRDYKYQRSDTKLEITKDQQKARVSMKLSEMMTAPSGTFRAETKQVCIYVLKNGKLLIQSVDSESTASRVEPASLPQINKK